jgi:hypothetical protein
MSVEGVRGPRYFSNSDGFRLLDNHAANMNSERLACVSSGTGWWKIFDRFCLSAQIRDRRSLGEAVRRDRFCSAPGT